MEFLSLDWLLGRQGERRRRGRALVLALALVAGLLSAPATAQGIRNVAIATATADVTLTTTTENVAVSSGPVTVPTPTARVCAIGWAQLTTGAATTTVTPRIRRGTAITGTAVGDAVAVTIGAAAGSTEQYSFMACEERANVATVDYSFTLQQASATGNGTVTQGGIFVFVF